MGFDWILRNFRFLSFHWGRALFSFTLSTVSVANQDKEFIQVVMATYFFLVGCSFLTLAIADREHDVLEGLKNLDEEREITDKQDSKKKGYAIRNIASAAKKALKSGDSAGESGFSTADYGSDLFSELGSDHENSKYGINALRRPFF